MLDYGGCSSTDPRKKGPVASGGYAGKGTEASAEEIKDTHPEQAQDDRKWSGENNPMFRPVDGYYSIFSPGLRKMVYMLILDNDKKEHPEGIICHLSVFIQKPAMI